jgi:hypothetical protein
MVWALEPVDHRDQRRHVGGVPEHISEQSGYHLAALSTMALAAKRAPERSQPLQLAAQGVEKPG